MNGKAWRTTAQAYFLKKKYMKVWKLRWLKTFALYLMNQFLL